MFEWDDQYLLGDIFIDNEHKLLFALAAKLTNEKGTITHDELVQYLRITLDYTRYHFKHEEQLMKEVGWDGFEHHCDIHKAIITEMRELIANNPDVMKLQVRLSQVLNKWIVEHVTKEDHKFKAELIKKRGFLKL